MKTNDERKAELAKMMQTAADQANQSAEVQRRIGKPDLWGQVADHLINTIEEIACDIVNRERTIRPE